jgi:segregation and condensation protein B
VDEANRNGQEEEQVEPAAEEVVVTESGGSAPAEERESSIPESRKAIVEALLFSANTPVKANRIAAAAEIETKQVEAYIQELNAEYDREKRAFSIVPVARGYQMMSRPAYFPYIQKLVKTRAKDKLTQATLETLAIIAYKQPIIRADIEAIRGVQSGQLIRNLLDRRLVRVVGRDTRLGHPLLYGTTPRFLEVFGLKSLKELPTVEELKAM